MGVSASQCQLLQEEKSQMDRSLWLPTYDPLLPQSVCIHTVTAVLATAIRACLHMHVWSVNHALAPSKETVGTPEGHGDLEAKPTFRIVRNLQPHVQTVGSNEGTIPDRPL